jgi:putative addiction module component (TIGR02574 family)
MTANALEKEALKLSAAKRVRLAEKLLKSVDDFTSDDIAAAWKREITRRVSDIDAGKEPGIPAEQAHDEARRRLRETRRISSAGSKGTVR